MRNVKPILSVVLSAIAVSCLMTGCAESGEQAAVTVNTDAAAAENADTKDDILSSMNIVEIPIDYIPTADDMASLRETERYYDEQQAKYEKMLPTDYTDIPQEMTYGIMTDIDNYMVSHMKYVNDNGKMDIYTDLAGKKVTDLNYLDMRNAEIVFENGSAASKDNLTPGTAVLVKYDMIEETYPGNMHCTKIVILK